MPIYEYRCQKCGHRFELKQPFGSKPPKRCPADGCAGKVSRVFTPPAIIFRGPGFHVTDYGRGNGKGKKDAESRASEAAEKVSSSSEVPKPSGGKD